MSETQSTVLVIDDSAVVREVLSFVIQSDPSLRLLGTASDPIFALQKMKEEWPDVIILDIEMPRMDGLTFLRQLSKQRPTPVVLCSSHAEKNARVTLEAYSLGAAEAIAKPKFGLRDFLSESAEEILRAVKSAARADVRKLFPLTTGARLAAPVSVVQPEPAITVAREATVEPAAAGSALILIGASTGGTTALEQILSELPAGCPPILIVQHMPENFTHAFAQRLDQRCALTVREAADGETLQAGLCLLAPGGKHMRLSPGGRNVQIFDGPLVNRHRPSVDVLFESAARRPETGGVLALLLTGMGGDGSRGLLHLREAGAMTIGQDRESSVVYGMAAEAMKLGAVQQELPLARMPAAIVEFAAGRRRAAG